MDSIQFLIQIVVFLYSVILHEIAHGYVAYRYGDLTAKLSGRLSFNPIVHIDPIGSLAVPGLLFMTGAHFLFGWAKPVPVSPANLRGGIRSLRLVTMAGIITNIALALFAALVLMIATNFDLPPSNIGVYVFFQIIAINLILAIFNTLPMPGFDGYNLLATYPFFQRIIERTPLRDPFFMMRYGMIIAFGLLFVFMPVISRLFGVVLTAVIYLFGLDSLFFG